MPKRQALSPSRLRFAALLDALRAGEDRRYVLAELNDLLTTLAPMEVQETLGAANLRDLSPFLQNYVAAMVEEAAACKGVEPPAWVVGVPPLTEPWFATPLPGLRLHLLQVSPVPFRRRNLFVDASVGDRV